MTISRGFEEACGIEVRAHPAQNRRMAHWPLMLVAIQLSSPPEIPSGILQAARRQAEYIMTSAGVKLQWRDAARLHLQIANTAIEIPVRDAAGFAVLVTGNPGYAAVAWPSIQRQAAQMEVDPSILLGAVMAHEVGHLLFGPSHAPGGIMSARLGPKEMVLAARGELRFESGPALCATRNSRRAGLPEPCATEFADTTVATAREHTASRVASAGNR